MQATSTTSATSTNQTDPTQIDLLKPFQCGPGTCYRLFEKAIYNYPIQHYHSVDDAMESDIDFSLQIFHGVSESEREKIMAKSNRPIICNSDWQSNKRVFLYHNRTVQGRYFIELVTDAPPEYILEHIDYYTDDIIMRYRISPLFNERNEEIIMDPW